MFIFFSVGKSEQTGTITAIITQQNSVKWQLILPPTYLCSCLLKATYKYCISFKKVSFTKAPEAMRANMRSMSGHTGCDHHLTRVSKSIGRQRKKNAINSHQSFLVWINIIYRPNLEWAINQEWRILTSAIKNFYMEGRTCSFTVLLISVEPSNPRHRRPVWDWSWTSATNMEDTATPEHSSVACHIFRGSYGDIQ